MLALDHVSKRYVTGGLTQQALDDVSLGFRNSEFVSILGPSGSGKTTMLNIIGGLDRYDSGDLIIDGVSTKRYRDADWDAYRNHTIGFVFQSYNLIGHQTVLANVELALTIGGVSRGERREKAMTALAKVGLAGQEHKKPNQMSGGQMQRVAIARALVNDPAILLADEPTGALDTATGIQIMELLREVSKDRLVIMVTHNPELAERYSTRIVRLADGHVVDDTMPFDATAVAIAGSTGDATGVGVPGLRKPRRGLRPGRVGMSWATSLSLSFANLSTKKARTVLTSFAGSIGIIGIASILALSSGVNTYIADLQRDTMSSYPITINSQSVDMTSLMGSMMGGTTAGGATEAKKADADRTKAHVDYSDIEQSEAAANAVKTNDLTEFKRYLDDPDSDIRQYLGDNGIVYSYDVPFSVLADDPDGNVINTETDVAELTGDDTGSVATSAMGATGANGMMSGGMGGLAGGAAGLGSTAAGTGSSDSSGSSDASSEESQASNFSQMTPGPDGEAVSDLTRDSYELLSGSWVKQSGDVMLVLDENNALPAGTLLQLGLISADEYTAAADAIADGKDAETIDWNVDDLVGRTFTLVSASDRYQDNGDGTFTYLADGDDNWDELRSRGITLTVSGVIRPADDAQNATISTAVAYTSQLTDQLIVHADGSAVVTTQEASPDTNVLTGTAFADEIDDATDDDIEQAYDDNLAAFGKVSYDAPSSISIYADGFDDKEAIADCITAYNQGKDEDRQITYTDYVALMTSSVTTIVNVISTVLIAFVAVSLIVSCIMIGIITRISVLERTKEIGVLRALGASRRNISQVFNAETAIIGLCAGLLGVGVTALLTIPANAVVGRLLGAGSLTVALPVRYAAVLVAISVIITMLGGLLPARKAAKQDPVIALRAE
ncbi:ATP-binding cassette domain-containing protein [Bifidobacterium amazonense]